MKIDFTLRKGKIIEVINQRVYIIEDLFNGNKIVTTASGLEMLNGELKEVEGIVYVVVAPQNLYRGRFYGKNDVKTEYNRNLVREKLLLDEGEDPLM